VLHFRKIRAIEFRAIKLKSMLARLYDFSARARRLVPVVHLVLCTAELNFVCGIEIIK
jgi:hypothetical protein